MADEPVPNQNQQQPNPSEKPAKSGLLAVADELYGTPKPQQQQQQPSKPQGDPPSGDPPSGDAPIGDPPSGDPDGAADEVELSSLAQLSDWVKQHDPDIDLPIDALMQLKVSTKVNGKDGEISIAEAIKSVQIGRATEEELTSAKTKAQQIIAEATQQKQQLEASVAVVSQMLQDVENEINADVQGTNWAKLREDDPAMYAAKKEELRERREKLDGRKRQAAGAYLQALQQQQQQSQGALQQYIEAEKSRLVAAIPEMADDEKSKALKTKIADHLLSRGFTRDEVAKAYDHRMIVMAHEAMQFREAKQKAGAIKKKVIKIPKVTKPGASQSQPKPNGAAKSDPVSILYPN